jgi:predicted RNase H-like HicB family nuclease
MKSVVNTAVYSAVLNPSPGGGYEVSFPDFPGCVTFGENFEEALEKGTEVLSLWIEELEVQHQTIPHQAARPIIADIKVSFA